MKKEKIILAWRILLLCLIVLNVAFIFFQSTRSKDESKETSDNVGEIVGEIIPPDTKPGGFIQTNLRKIAHFVEFASLGALTSLYLIFFKRRILFAALSFPTGLFIALFDETIQIFSSRGSSVKDVWIDFLGFASISIIFYTVAFICEKAHKNVNKSSQNFKSVE